MTDNGATLTVDSKGFVYSNGVRLDVRYEAGALEFVIKHPGDRARLGRKLERVPVSKFRELEASPAPAPRRSAGRMPRDSKRRIVPPRNKRPVDKSG